MNENNQTTVTDIQTTALPVLETHEEVKHESTLYAEPVAHFHGFPITNALITSWVAVLVIVILSVALRTRMKKIPTKLQHFFEMFMEGALNLADQVTGIWGD